MAFGISIVAHFAVGAEIAYHHSLLVGVRIGNDLVGVIVAVVTYGLGLAFGSLG